MAARIRLRGLGQYAGFVRVRYNAAMPPTSKLRHLFHALSVLSAVACVLLIVLWVRSYTVADRLHGRFWGQQSFVLGSNEGRLAAVAYPSSDELSFPVGWARAYESTLGFGWFENPETTLSQTWDLGIGSDMVVHIGSGPIGPYWFLTLLCGTMAAIPWLSRLWRPQFSLRTLLIATTFVAVVLGMVAWAAK